MQNQRTTLAAFAALFTFVIHSGATIELPPGEINLAVKEGSVSFFQITLSGVPPGYSVGNKTYSAWCVNRYNDYNPADNGGLHTGFLLDTTSGALPGDYASKPWDKINYLLNNKLGSIDDVQNAVWFFTDGIVPNAATSPLAVQMVAQAQANGSGFVPTGNQITAALVIWTSPNPAVQGNVIEVPGTPDVDTNNCADRFTAGGFIFRAGAKCTFGIQGGIKNGELAGGINYVDHGLKMHVKGRAITGYRALDANCREATYDVTINGAAGTAVVQVCDYGEPGRNDVVTVSLSNGYIAGVGTTLGDSGSGGGNVQLHKPNCNEPAQAKPNKPGKKPGKKTARSIRTGR